MRIPINRLPFLLHFGIPLELNYRTLMKAKLALSKLDSISIPNVFHKFPKFRVLHYGITMEHHYGTFMEKYVASNKCGLHMDSISVPRKNGFLAWNFWNGNGITLESVCC